MQARSFSGPLAVLLLLVGGVVPAGAGQPPKQDLPQPLPKEIVAAWDKAGGEPGWMGLHSLGFFVFAEEATGLTGAIPEFHFFSSGRTGSWPSYRSPQHHLGSTLSKRR